MGGLRSIAGYLDSFVEADDRERQQLLQEMQTLLGVGTQISQAQTARQRLEMERTKEQRLSELHPLEKDQMQVAVEAARQALESARAQEEEAKLLRPIQRRGTVAGVQQQEAVAGVAPDVQQANLQTLQEQLSRMREENLSLKESNDRYRDAIAELSPRFGTPERARAFKEITQPTLEGERAQRLLEYNIPEAEAQLQQKTFMVENAIKGEMLKQNVPENQIRLSMQKLRAEILALRARTMADSAGGKSPYELRADIIKQVGTMQEVKAKLSAGLGLDEALELLPPNSAMLGIIKLQGTPDKALKIIDTHLLALKSLLIIDFGLNYDQLTDKGSIDFTKIPMGNTASYMQVYPGAQRPDLLTGSGAVESPTMQGLREIEGPTGLVNPPAQAPSIPEPTPETVPEENIWDQLDVSNILENLEPVAP